MIEMVKTPEAPKEPLKNTSFCLKITHSLLRQSGGDQSTLRKQLTIFWQICLILFAKETCKPEHKFEMCVE